MLKVLLLILIILLCTSCGVKVEVTSLVPAATIGNADNREPFLQLVSQRDPSIPFLPQRLVDSSPDQSLSVSGDGRYMVFSSNDTFSVGVRGTRVYLFDRFNQEVILVSRTSSPEVFETGISQNAKISRDGSTVLFLSSSSNLDSSGSTSGNLFSFDVASGRLRRLGIDVEGDFDLSDDGQKIAFLSARPDLVVSDNNGLIDAFVLDQLTQSTKRVSVSNTGQESNGEVREVSISRDGLIVSFTTVATNLIDGVNLPRPGPFVYHVLAEKLEMVGIKPVRSDTETLWASISFDGSKILFASAATNLGPTDTTPTEVDLYLEDRATSLKRLVVPSANYGVISSNGRYVAYRDSYSGQFFRTDLDISGSGTSPVSSSQDGTLSNDSLSQTYLSISSDGRFVAFSSSGTNLIASDTNGFTDVFVKDFLTREVILASSASGGGQANGDSILQSLSADGRFVVFTSGTTNLIPGGTNGRVHVYRKNLSTGDIQIVSVDSNGIQGNGHSSEADVSEDGRYVTFSSTSSNLVTADTNNRSDVYLKDMDTGEITLLSSDSIGMVGDGHSSNPKISADGGVVIFLSAATNLVSSDTNSVDDIFIKDTITGQTTLVSRGNRGAIANDFSKPGVISPDGRVVAFLSYATNLLDQDTDGRLDLYVKDLTTNRFSEIRGIEFPLSLSNGTRNIKLTQNGSQLFFESQSNEFVADDFNGTVDVFKYDLGTKMTSRVSLSSSGDELSQDVYLGDVSSDGSAYQLLTLGDMVGMTPSLMQLYLRDESRSHTSIVSTAGSLGVSVSKQHMVALLPGGESFFAAEEGDGFAIFQEASGVISSQPLPIYDGDDGQGQSSGAKVSRNGRYVVFSSYSALIPEDTNDQGDVYIKDTISGQLRLVSTDTLGNLGNNISALPAISEDGRYVAFMSFASNFSTNDTNSTGDIFLKDLTSGELTLVSTSVSSAVPGNGFSLFPDISSDGSIITFISSASDLVTGDTNNQRDVFLWERRSRQSRRVSNGLNGSQSNGDSSSPSITGDGGYIVFDSEATNLVPTTTSGLQNVFRADVKTGAIELVSIGGTTSGDDRSFEPKVSDDGRFVVFSSRATNFTSLGTNGFWNVYLKDMVSGELKLVSGEDGILMSNGSSFGGDVSDDGRYVVFATEASNLLSSQPFNKVILKDLWSDEFILISSSLSGAPANRYSVTPSLSGDGKFIAFCSRASSLILEKKIFNDIDQIFLKKWKQ